MTPHKCPRSIVFVVPLMFLYSLLIAQDMSVSETVSYINQKLRAYEWTYVSSHTTVFKAQIEVRGDYLIVKEVEDNKTNDSKTYITSKVSFRNLSPNTRIEKGRTNLIQLNSKNRERSIENVYRSGDYSNTSYYSNIKIAVRADNEKAQYLCNAFNHLIDFKQTSMGESSDPFANYQQKTTQKQNTTTTKSKTAPPTKPKASTTTATPKVTWRTYTSSTYGYTIKVLSNFTKTSATGGNIHMKFVTKDGTNILVNVSPKTRDEQGQTAHDYSRQMFEDTYKQYNLSTKIISTEKTFVAGNKAFKLVYLNPSNNTKAIEYYFYRGNYAYVLTGTTKVNQYSRYTSQIESSLKSITFK